MVLTSVSVGFLFGGKTWCNYFCPIAPVQRFYTEPRGLFEKSAHLSLTVISGSMCRTTDASGRETSDCVGCKSPCPDVDLERAYWSDLESAPRRFVYYGYAGLVAGYVGFNLLSQSGAALPGPRALTGPVAIVTSVLAFWALGVLLEKAYASLRSGALSSAQARHQVFAVTTFLTFNVFYLLGGRALLSLLPEWGRLFAQFGVVVVSSLWLVQALSRSAQKYERESLGNSLRKQLRKLNFDVGKVLGGRTLEDLAADEVYLLARALPELSSQQRRTAYKETVRESIVNGSATTSSGAAMLRDLRGQLAVSEAEHGQVLTELGVEDGRLFDPEEIQSQEKWLRLESYREALEGMVIDLVHGGQPVQEAMRSPEILARVRRLQQQYGIGKEDQQKVAAELLGANGRLLRELGDVLLRLTELGARAGALRLLLEREATLPLARGLLRMIAGRRRESTQRALGLLSALGPTTEAIEAAERLALLAPDEVSEAFAHPAGPGARAWPEVLSPGMAAVLSVRGGTAEPKPRLGPATALSAIIHEPEPIARAVALQALALVDPALAAEEAKALEGDEQHWLVRESARGLQAMPLALGHILWLAEAPLFEELQPEALSELAREAETRAVPAGTAICLQGAPSNELLLLIRGTAEVELERDGGKLIVARLAPGQVIGELGVLTRSPRSATVRAGANGADLVAIPGRRLESLLLQDGRMATGLLRTVSQRLGQTLGQLAGAASRP